MVNWRQCPEASGPSKGVAQGIFINVVFKFTMDIVYSWQLSSVNLFHWPLLPLLINVLYAALVLGNFYQLWLKD